MAPAISTSPGNWFMTGHSHDQDALHTQCFLPSDRNLPSAGSWALPPQGRCSVDSGSPDVRSPGESTAACASLLGMLGTCVWWVPLRGNLGGVAGSVTAPTRGAFRFSCLPSLPSFLEALGIETRAFTLSYNPSPFLFWDSTSLSCLGWAPTCDPPASHIAMIIGVYPMPGPKVLSLRNLMWNATMK